MEPYKRIDSPFHTRRRSKTFGLGKTTLGVREHVQAVGLNAETKNYRQRAEGEIFLLTLPLIGPYRLRAFPGPNLQAALVMASGPLYLLGAAPDLCSEKSTEKRLTERQEDADE